jgi:hypothetical protein
MQRLGALVLVAGALAGTMSDAHAQTTTAKPPVVDTAATNALVRMGAYLRSLETYQVKANVTTEDVLDDGQKIQFASRLDAVVDKPNKMRLELASDLKQRVFIYDGTQFTIFAPRQNFYSTVPAPKTIAELATMLEDKYGIDMPFVDLFRWGTSEGDIDDIDAAKDIGQSQIDGVTCQHYAFRQTGLDWQVWIQNGEFPLPRKLVITTLTDDARPQHEAIYTWNLAPSYNDQAFVFKAPDNAKKIPIADVAAMRTKKTGGSDK